jgi:hypothetical protein
VTIPDTVLSVTHTPLGLGKKIFSRDRKCAVGVYDSLEKARDAVNVVNSTTTESRHFGISNLDSRRRMDGPLIGGIVPSHPKAALETAPCPVGMK